MEADQDSTVFLVLHKSGRVILQTIHAGESGVPSIELSWSPQRAREIATLILATADLAEENGQ